MSNPARFWGRLVGGFIAMFAAVDLACARGPANGDTFSECLGAWANTPTKRAVGLTLWTAFALWAPWHILKDRFPLVIDLDHLID